MKTSCLLFSLLLALTLLSSCAGLASTSDSTLEAQWTTLFDGESTEHWRAFKQESFPSKGWDIQDGCLHVISGGGGGDIITTQQYENFEFELEWKVSPKANSGIMYRVSEAGGASYSTGPEYQVLDDAGRSGSTTAGGLYALYNPQGKVLKPVGEFNQTRIVVCGNHVEHYLNGVKLLEAELHSIDWDKRVKASKFVKMPLFGTVGRGHIALQDHGNDVWYRNIRIRELSLTRAQGAKPVVMFNGKDLKGWTHFSRDPNKAMADVWSVADGVLVCQGKPIGYLRSKEKYQDFVLELDWRWSPETKKAGNSGVLLRMTGEDKVWPKSIEAQLQSGRAGDFWNIGDCEMTTDARRLKGRNTKHIKTNERAVGEWNHYRMIVNDGKVELYVNDELVNEAWGCTRDAGHICLQSEGTEIHFRNIVLTPLLSKAQPGS